MHLAYFFFTEIKERECNAEICNRPWRAQLIFEVVLTMQLRHMVFCKHKWRLFESVIRREII